MQYQNLNFFSHINKHTYLHSFIYTIVVEFMLAFSEFQDVNSFLVLLFCNSSNFVAIEFFLSGLVYDFIREGIGAPIMISTFF